MSSSIAGQTVRRESNRSKQAHAREVETAVKPRGIRPELAIFRDLLHRWAKYVYGERKASNGMAQMQYGHSSSTTGNWLWGVDAPAAPDMEAVLFNDLFTHDPPILKHYVRAFLDRQYLQPGLQKSKYGDDTRQAYDIKRVLLEEIALEEWNEFRILKKTAQR